MGSFLQVDAKESRRLTRSGPLPGPAEEARPVAWVYAGPDFAGRRFGPKRASGDCLPALRTTRRPPRRAISCRRPLNIHSCTGRRTYQYARPSRPRGSNALSAEERSPAVVERRDLEFQPTAAGQLQIGPEPQASIRSCASTVQPSMTSVSPQFPGSRRPRPTAPAQTEVQPASRSPASS